MRPTILLVDDNEDYLELMELALQNTGYELRTAVSGREGLKILSSGLRPSLIILDVEISDMTGPQFLDALESSEENTPARKIVFCSAGPRPDDPRVCGYVNKMMDLQEFHRTILQVLNLAAS